MKKKSVKVIVSALLLLSILLCLQANLIVAEHGGRVITNSENWKDVYSTMLFSSLTGKAGSFLVSDKHSTIILGSIPKDTHVWTFSSIRTPFILGYPSLIESRGYVVVGSDFDNFNQELGERAELDDVFNFIIIDDSYGYNAIAVAPYAVVSRSWVLFADRSNIDEVEDFLNARTVNDLLIYGQVDREVRDVLDQFDPEIINFDNDRFENNVEIVKRYMEIGDAKQVILTNGEFIEREIMAGAEPVLFIGQNNVPDAIKEYIQNSKLEVGVLIGNELVGSATSIRRQIGISVFVKFAQGARQPGSAISQVEALDMYYLPTYNLNLELESGKYNKATNQLEITLRNTVDQVIYFKGTYSVDASDGSSQVVGDTDSVFIDGRSLKTMTYDLSPLPEGKIEADVFIIYGESKKALERIIDTRIEIETVSILDNCEIALNQLFYNKRANDFIVEIENIADVDCYVKAEAIDVIIDNQRTTLAQEDITKIAVGKKEKVKIDADLSDEDIEDNPRIKIRAHYGERSNNLIKIKEADLDLLLSALFFGMTPGDLMFYALLIVIIILVSLIVYKRRKNQAKYSF